MSMSMREMGVRSGRMDGQLGQLTLGLEQVKQGLEEVRAMTEDNRRDFLELADKMDETLAVMKSFAFGQA